ncbi:hypothetical protein P279_27170 [Rhodobacteraceae bacterium PD-2]|nr:hypothetical protein P279_27170 [Rhodobacteraceae bacterium PD-2]
MRTQSARQPDRAGRRTRSGTRRGLWDEAAPDGSGRRAAAGRIGRRIPATVSSRSRRASCRCSYCSSSCPAGTWRRPSSSCACRQPWPSRACRPPHAPGCRG